MPTALLTQGEGGMLYNHTHLMCPIVITLSSLQRQLCGKRSAAFDQRGGQFFFAYLWNNVEKYETAKWSLRLRQGDGDGDVNKGIKKNSIYLNKLPNISVRKQTFFRG